jgi:LPS-assembly protein
LGVALPQLCSAQTTAAPAAQSETQATVEKPDFSVKVPRPNAPPPGYQDMTSTTQESDGSITRLHGMVVVELSNATFRADEAEYNEDTKIFTAHGHVSYRNYDHNEIIYCDSAEYNTVTRHGTFHHVQGYTKTKVVARPGLLTTQEPFYFEGESAEKFEDRYVIYNGIITDCHIPNPWWTLHSKSFTIVPEDHATTRNGVFRLRKVPVFFFPYYYKPLKKEPRKSGFTTPEAGHSSQFGYFFGAGYYWAINRSYDLTYLFEDYTSRGYSHHIDFRGKPTQKLDYDLIFYGVQDRGIVSNGVVTGKAPGYTITGVARADLGDGWIARANVDYVSSYLFRETFSGSFNEAIYSSDVTSANITKHFDYYSFAGSISRIQNFESTNPGDSITIRKLPDGEFEGRDQQILNGPLPLWFSFQSSFGLFHRAEPTAEPGYYETNQFTPRGDMAPSLTSAFHWGDFSIVPSATLHETFYGQSLINDTVSSSSLNRTAPEITVDFVLPPIERVFDRKTFLGDKLKHVIEPRFTYKYVSGVNDFPQTLLFDALDLLNNTNQLQIGVTNRLYAKKGDAVNEVLTWAFYQQRYFDPTFGGAVVPGARNIIADGLDITGYSFLAGPRNYSPIVSSLRISPRPGFGITWQADYDPLVHQLVNTTFSADIRYKKYFISAGDNFLKPNPIISPPANQVRAQFGYGDPNRKGWNTAFSTVYDYRLALMEFAIAQVTYNTDCCGFSFEYRRFNFGVRDDTQYRIAFSIANIGTFGNLKKQERLF